MNVYIFYDSTSSSPHAAELSTTGKIHGIELEIKPVGEIYVIIKYVSHYCHCSFEVAARK